MLINSFSLVFIKEASSGPSGPDVFPRNAQRSSFYLSERVVFSHISTTSNNGRFALVVIYQ